MFEQLITFTGQTSLLGIVESIRANEYLAQQIDQEGTVVNQAPFSFKSFDLAKVWLKQQGVQTISLRQSPAYFEMI